MSETVITGWAAKTAGGVLEPYEYDPGPLGDDEVEIGVDSCGLCHSDVSILHNDWGVSRYPVIPGHEVVGRIERVGEAVTHLGVGRLVGLGWFARSCAHCGDCMRGDHNLCPSRQDTIIGRHGGFADRVRCAAHWAVPLPEGLDPATAGPMFCGGITVFNPIVRCGVRPTDRVGVVGIGGLGHLALQFLSKWGCEVTAFTSTDAKAQEARDLGAHHVVNSRDESALKSAEGSLDFLLSTVNVPLDWDALFGVLRRGGRFHNVGAVTDPIPVRAIPTMLNEWSFSGTPLGSPATCATMLEFAARHGIGPRCEIYPMSRVNEAVESLRTGRPRYRIVLQREG